MKSTNYFNTFIEVADDCPVDKAEIPQTRGGKKSIPVLQYEMIGESPYRHSSDDVLYTIYAVRNDNAPESNLAREAYFSKGQPCLRASSLGKRYGWGIHFNEEGAIAIYPVESKEYQKFKEDPNLEHTKAMRSSKN